MKYAQNLIKITGLLIVVCFGFPLRAQGAWISPDLLHVSCGGQIAQESFMATNLNLLNASVPQDSIGYLRSTIDYFLHCTYGEQKDPRIDMYSVMRFRYIWGSTTSTQIADSTVTVINTPFTIKGTSTNKHLLWMRESWLKVMIGAEHAQQDFVQIGLIPFEVGRGISLGAAYDSSGFLGFTTGYAIDQYAPAVLLRFQLAKKSNIDAYFALVENNQTTVDETFESIHPSELNACAIRGVGRQSYIVALRNKTVFENDKKFKWTVEPYLVHQQAPDKHFEFKYDIDSSISSCGLCVETEYDRLSWGFEAACNMGDVYIKPWDRNRIKIVKKDNGSLVEQYTKIYNQDPANSAAILVDATTANAVFVDGLTHDVSANGKQIGPNLFNAFDRFRPAQNINLKGYFFVADLAYEYIPKVLTCGLGVGYVSGGIHHQRDMNHATSEECLNQDFTGFIPLQSEYSGTRIRHFVMLNQGVPRFTVANLGTASTTQNITPAMTLDAINTMTNITFLGARAAFNPSAWKKHSVLLAPNIIFYWSPEISHVVTQSTSTSVSVVQPADNFLGTELNLEFSMQIMKSLKLEGYAGILIPGPYYKAICGTIVQVFNKPIGTNVAYVGNIGLAYSF